MDVCVYYNGAIFVQVWYWSIVWTYIRHLIKMWMFSTTHIYVVMFVHTFFCLYSQLHLGGENIWSVTCTSLLQFGRIDPHYPKVCGHQGNVLDIKWNPFHDNIIASCSEDSSVSKLKVQNHYNGQITQHHLNKLETSFCAMKTCKTCTYFYIYSIYM